jgi:arylsulfatase A-like enzyme
MKVKFHIQGLKLNPTSRYEARQRRFDRGSGAWWLMILLSMGPGFFSANVPGATPRNILLIIADDYGADSSSLYNSTANGASLPPTPNIEALARSGVVFRNAYANPVCSPTRACLITGRHGFRTGVGDVIGGAGNPPLRASEFTLPEAFGANSSLGYQLAQFGKWHLANGLNSPSTIGGWPYFAGSLDAGVANYTNWTKTVNGVSTANYTNYATTDVVNDAITWIRARGSQPWLAWVAFNAPHSPYHKPPTNLAPHYASLSGTQASINANPRSYYEAMVEAMDTEIGRLLAAVDRTNTHVIFLGDNGTPSQTLQPPYPSGRGKFTLYEGGIRVPLIAAGPSVVSPGRTNDTLVHAVDVFATILELAGINSSATIPTNIVLDAQSFLSALVATSNLPRHSFSEKFGNATPSVDGRALRNTQFKLLQYTNGVEAFYDLAADPYEATNLLRGTLTATQQANYYSLVMRLGSYQDTLAPPVILRTERANSHFTMVVQRTTNLIYSLWRAAAPENLGWAPLSNAVVVTNSATEVILKDTNAIANGSYYRVGARR